jgi:hypothetical protein
VAATSATQFRVTSWGLCSHQPGVHWDIWDPAEEFRVAKPEAWERLARPPVVASVTVVEVGWPVYCARRVTAHPTDPPVAPGFFRLHPTYGAPGALRTQWPSFRPLWLGLVVNLVVFSGTTMCLSMGLRKMALFWKEQTAMRRLAAGVCAACGYSRSGLSPTTRCPECGAIPDGHLTAHDR